MHSQGFSAPLWLLHHWDKERGLSMIDGALTPPGCFAIDLLGSPDRAKKTHAPDRMPPLMGKQFSAGSCGKAVHFLFSRSGEHHILWLALSVSVKGICYAVFTVWVSFRPMRATQRAARFLWKQSRRCQIITLAVFWKNC